MTRIVLAIILAALVLAIVALADCALSVRDSVRTLPKAVWVVIVVVLPIVGPLLWFFLGRPSARQLASAATSRPDDDPGFLEGLDAQQRVRKLEEELARLERENFGDTPGDDGTAPGPNTDGHGRS
ncbi:MAG TPA: hypothetical protein GX406_07390 [Pseudoclavibacter sp.]|nr:hypothetical protein [Pseudoclavibacter sp.]